jgi:putative nucleotidyltransferase with HDIG domain
MFAVAHRRRRFIGRPAVVVPMGGLSVADIKGKVMQAMRELPSLPLVVQKLLTVMNDPRSSLEDVTRVLSSDQALTGKVLKLVNSPFYGMSGEVATVSRAVLVMGYSGLRSVATGFCMATALAKLGGGRGLADFWNHSLATAAGGQVFAELRRDTAPDPEEVFVAGLLHDVGHVVLASAVPEAYAEAQAAAVGQAEPLQAERAVLSMDHTQVGQKLLQYWKLPDTLQDSARRHHSIEICGGGSQPLTTMVAIGDTLACLHGGAFEPTFGEEDINRLLRPWQVEVSAFSGMLDEMTVRISQMNEFLKLAGTDAGPGTTPADAPRCPAVVVSFDEAHLRWVTTFLRRAGHPLQAFRDFVNGAPEAQEVKLVVLDPTGLTHEKLAKLLALLRRQPLTVCILDLGDGTAGLDLLAKYPRLPYAFSRTDIDKLIDVLVTA